MATMLNGAAVMDASLLVIAGKKICPQPQPRVNTWAAVEIMCFQEILILQSKRWISDRPPEAAWAHQKQIRRVFAGTVADGAPFLPVSESSDLDVLCEYLVHKVPPPTRDSASPPARLVVICSFAVNPPVQDAAELQGGVDPSRRVFSGLATKLNCDRVLYTHGHKTTDKLTVDGT